jgi:hypothetical protein
MISPLCWNISSGINDLPAIEGNIIAIEIITEYVIPVDVPTED